MTSPYAGMTALLYARVSTDDHDQDPESQLMALRAYARAHDIDVIGEYADRITGTTMDRPQLDAMLGRVMRERVGLILALDPDRVSRSMADKSALLDMLRPYGTVIRYLSDESATPETAEGRLIDTLRTYGAQRYTDSHRLKIRAGLDRARAQGRHIGRPRAVIERDTLAAILADHSTGEAADILGVTAQTVRNYRRRYGLRGGQKNPPQKNHWGV